MDLQSLTGERHEAAAVYQLILLIEREVRVILVLDERHETISPVE